MKWRIEYIDDEFGYSIDAGDRHLCLVYDKHDAHLVAAAPDLLEACENLLVYLDVNSKVSEAVRRQAQAVIGAAKGIEPR